MPDPVDPRSWSECIDPRPGGPPDLRIGLSNHRVVKWLGSGGGIRAPLCGLCRGRNRSEDFNGSGSGRNELKERNGRVVLKEGGGPTYKNTKIRAALPTRKQLVK